MSKSESRVLLLENDHLEMAMSDQEKDGFSSGYDSAQEVSDTETSLLKVQQPYLTCDSQCDSESEDEATEVMSYKSTKALCEHLKYIVSMPELCDVTFLVGPTKVPVYGVKAILGTRSRVLYQLILNQQHQAEAERSTFKKFRKSSSKSRVVIEVNKYEPEDFRMLMQFVHCGSVDIGIHNVAGLLCGAYQFGLEDLRSACWDFVRRSLDSASGQDTAHALMASAFRYNHHKTTRKLVSKINKVLQETEHKKKDHFHDQQSNGSKKTSKMSTTV
ncbi:serine-enriched protein-like [Mizuhopecten yessoensis]|uniref:Serine-enriched protein n=1 Tax=Mizuhopecten yessoensis TaxID=6573 RepID=A0A210QAG2_MIZYE|nr:serine-enriched protein-like [Mizuhopecten yessoensis]OWF45718.1 Serine-enriched protein [Mizuhopecten yessoensis]